MKRELTLRQKITVTCHACGGVGVVELPLHLADMLHALNLYGAATAKQTQKSIVDRIGLNAVSKRLAELHQYGLAQRRKQGKAWLYRIKGYGKWTPR